MLIKNTSEEGEKRFLKSLFIEHNQETPMWPLPNMQPAKEKDFWGHRASYSFRGEAWMGKRKIDGRWATVLIYFADISYSKGGGFAVAYFYAYREEEVKYYSWTACVHDWKETTIGHCLHRSTCSKCKETFTTDTSG